MLVKGQWKRLFSKDEKSQNNQVSLEDSKQGKNK